MSTSRISTCFAVLAAVFALAGSLFAQGNPVTPPPSATAGVFPLSEVHRGLHGVAYTVFEGTQPETMDVEILGVLKNVLGPDQDMILARLHGSKPEYTGVVAGMSGSPVYIDGKLLGALSYRIGQFSKGPSPASPRLPKCWPSTAAPMRPCGPPGPRQRRLPLPLLQ